ncbi:hypothetical protein OAE21_02685 [Rubripirellula sp.]|nr:hypothetical protein [Rubripirellula sp.]MDB4624958.1 hypothetical protein [Rubripirellula sp.]
MASANNPPKPLLTVESRQHTANENGGSFFGQNDRLIAVSADGFVVAQDAQEEIGNAASVDFVRHSDVIRVLITIRSEEKKLKNEFSHLLKSAQNPVTRGISFWR